MDLEYLEKRINRALAKGYSISEIRQILIEIGAKDKEIDAILEKINKGKQEKNPEKQEIIKPEAEKVNPRIITRIDPLYKFIENDSLTQNPLYKFLINSRKATLKRIAKEFKITIESAEQQCKALEQQGAAEKSHLFFFFGPLCYKIKNKTIEDVAKEFKLTVEEAEQWCKALEEAKLVEIVYPLFSKTYVKKK